MNLQTVEYNRFEKGIDVRKASAVSDANRLRKLTNIYVTDGWALDLRPGLTKVATLANGTSGLAQLQGDLYTVSSNVEAVNSDGIGNIRIPLTGSTADIREVHYSETFNGQLYAVIEYSDGSVQHSYNGVAINGVDAPTSTSVVKLASRMYAIDGDIVRYSAVNDPTVWDEAVTTPPGAGFLPTGLQAPGDDEALAVSEYDGMLAVFMVDSIQLWTVDPDPALQRLEKIIRNVGTNHPKSIAQYSNDLMFLSEYGFRSISRQQFTDNREDNDIGTPIDELVRDLFDGGVTGSPKAVYYPRGGQYWCLIGTKVFVYSYSRGAKVNAWSEYEFADGFDDMISVKGDLYFRRGFDLLKLDESATSDDGDFYDWEIQMSFQNQKTPGVNKRYLSFDLVQEGSANVSFLTDPITEFETTPYKVEGNTRARGLNPIGIVSTEIAPRFTGSSENPYRLDAVILYFQKLGIR